MMMAKPAPTKGTDTTQDGAQDAASEMDSIAMPVNPPAIVHYHLFKNAGTSLDALFKEYFSDRWVTREFPDAPVQNRRHMQEWLTTVDADCYSTHTGFLPVPTLGAREVLPVIFLRHPLDRIASAYSFERRQGDPGFGSTLARNTTLRGYCEVRLSNPHDRQCRNFHAGRLAHLLWDAPGSQLGRALQALEELPFVGIVEQFNDSLKVLEAILQERGYPDIQLVAVRRNVSSERADSLEDRLASIRHEVGDEFYSTLVAANSDDIELHRVATERLASSMTESALSGD